MEKLKCYGIFRNFRKPQQKSSLVSKPSVDCRLLGNLEVIFTHFHFFALLLQNHFFAPKSLFRSKITFSLQNHFFAPKSLFRSKITFSLQNHFFCQKSTFRSFGAPCLKTFCRLSFLWSFGGNFPPWGDF